MIHENNYVFFIVIPLVINIQVDEVSLDSTSVKVHPDGTGALKKTVHNLSVSPEQGGQLKFIWLQPMPKQP